MNTSPPSPARTPRSAPHPASQHSRSNTEPPRQQAEKQGMKDRFTSKMEREEGGKPSQNRDMGGASSAADAPFGGKPPLDREGGDGGQSGFGQQGVQLQLSGAQALAGAQASAVPLDTAALQRMAAQIAEAAPGALSSEASITFPDGSLAESAQIKREPDGSVAIRIAGMDPRLTALQNGRAQLELLNGLALRRLKVSSLSLERTKPDQAGRDSAISRVV